MIVDVVLVSGIDSVVKYIVNDAQTHAVLLNLCPKLALCVSTNQRRNMQTQWMKAPFLLSA